MKALPVGGAFFYSPQRTQRTQRVGRIWRGYGGQEGYGEYRGCEGLI